MNFFSKPHKVTFIALLKLVIASLGTGATIILVSNAIGWILIMAAIFLGVLSTIEIYQSYKLERKKK